VFGGSGRRELGEAIRGPLVASAFPPLLPVHSALSAFLAATADAPGATPLDLRPDDVSLGEVDASIFLSRVRVPMRLDLGLLPRVQLGVSLPLVRGRQLVQRLGLVAPTVGANPAPTGNGELLARVGPNGAAVGNLPLLPTRESPAGRELQERVRAANDGDSLDLPVADSVPGAVLQRLLAEEFGIDSLRSAGEDWRPGDLEVEARVTLLDALGGAPLPDSVDGLRVRAAAWGGVRFPTGLDPDTATLFGRDPDVGLSGWQVGLTADLFFGSRSWLSVTLRQVVLTGGEVRRRLAPADAPLSTTAPPQRVRWSPGDTLQLRVSPRLRLADPISAGLDYEVQSVTEGRYEALAGGSAEGVELLATEGGMAHRVGAAIRFSSLPAYSRGAGQLPISVSLSYARLLAGPDGMAAGSRMQLEGSLYVALLGRGIRR
jgi:hypothetical protein